MVDLTANNLKFFNVIGHYGGQCGAVLALSKKTVAHFPAKVAGLRLQSGGVRRMNRSARKMLQVTDNQDLFLLFPSGSGKGKIMPLKK